MFAGPRPAGTAHSIVLPLCAVPVCGGSEARGVDGIVVATFLDRDLLFTSPFSVLMLRLRLLTGMLVSPTLVDRNIRSDPTQSGVLVQIADLVDSRSIETTRNVRNVLDDIRIRLGA